MRYPLVDAAGQLRLDRQRPAGGHALHRGAPVAARHGDAPRHRRGHRRLRAQLRRVAPGAARPAVALPEPAGQRRRRASRSGWPRTSRRTTSARRSTRSSPTSTIPDIDVQGLMKHIKGPDFPTGGHHRRARRHPRGLRDRPRPDRRARQGAHRADGARQGAHHRHRDALPGRQGRRARRRLGADQEDRRAGPQRPDQGDLGPARRVGPLRHPAGDRAQARRDAQGRPQQALQAHAAADHLRREHGRAGRRRAAHARPAADASATTSTTSATSSCAGPSTSCASARRGCTSSRACSSRSRTSTR